MQMLNKYSSYVVYVIYGLIVSFFAYYIVKNAAWCSCDDYEWLYTTALGQPESLMRHVGKGRFIPCNHFDTNFLVLIPHGESPLAHYIWVAFLFLTASFLFLKIKGSGFVKIAFFSWLLYQFLQVYLNIIFPEKIVIVELLLMIVMLQGFHKENKSPLQIVLYCLLVFYIPYTKEPLFGVLLTFAITEFLFRRKNLNKQEKMAYIVMIVSAVVFLSLYVVFIQFSGDTEYVEQEYNPFLSNIVFTFKVFPALWLMVILLPVRAVHYYIERKYYPIVDAAFVSAYAYMSSYFILTFWRPYYYYPCFVLLAPYVVFLIGKVEEKLKGWFGKGGIIACVVCMLPIFYISAKRGWVVASINQECRTFFTPFYKEMGEYSKRGDIYYFNVDGDKDKEAKNNLRQINRYVSYWLHPEYKASGFELKMLNDSVMPQTESRIIFSGYYRNKYKDFIVERIKDGYLKLVYSVDFDMNANFDVYEVK
ncbi:MAG: hypothetical protein J5676_05040 [Bacteroidaceae bacterium]|nr:hypothetical protein [Bacteroidaceae bacterium]